MITAFVFQLQGLSNRGALYKHFEKKITFLLKNLKTKTVILKS